MSTHINMSLDDSISKRKVEEPRGGRSSSTRPFRRGGFKSRGERRGDRGGFRRGSGFRRGFGGRDRSERFDRERRGGFRARREDRERREKFDDDKGPTSSLSKLGIRSRFIKRTRAGGRFGDTRPPRAERSERIERTERSERPERERPISERRRLRVSNLDFNITHKDLLELFSKLGSLTKNKIEYDDLGRSKGTALIEYEKHDSAVKAMTEYDGAVLDGRTITVEFDDDAKRRKGDSSLVKKVITKDYNFERGGRRRFDDRRDDREDREDRGDRGDRGDRDRFRRGFRRDGFGGKARWGKRD